MTTVLTPRGDAETASPRAGNRPLRPARRRRTTAIAWGFCLPFIILFAAFGLGPVLASLGMSVTDITSRDLRDPFNVNFIGLGNYIELFSDPRFVRSALNTLYFVAVGIPLTMVIALAVALALDKGIRHLRSFFRVGYFAPVVTSVVAVAVVWEYLYREDGLINSVLGWMGVAGPDWLNDEVWAMPALIVMAAWRNFGIPMVIFLAGLQGIPRELYDAANVDGAGAAASFRHITLPLLRPTTLVIAILLSVGFLQFFEEPYVMTNGGPLDSTLSIGFYAYNQFGFGNYGLASAASYVLVAAIVAVSVLQFRLFRRKG